MKTSNTGGQLRQPWTTTKYYFHSICKQVGMIGLFCVAGCANSDEAPMVMARPDVSSVEPLDDVTPLSLDRTKIEPMYTEILPVDLASVVRVALADNFDIQQAQLIVQAREGRYESVVGGAFPAIVPTAIFDYVEGSVRATEGNIVGVGFKSFQPSIAVQWVVNPGRVIYDILAAKKRVAASTKHEEAVVLNTLRMAANQYYSLVLAQASVSASYQGVLEADELLRISELRQMTGTGVLADQLRAEARLAARKQDLVIALKTFYDLSVTLALTLHLDAVVTLVPNIDSLPPTRLIRTDLTIEEMLGYAVAFRADLASVRILIEATAADRGSTWWSGFGPTLMLSYQYGGITGHANNVVDNPGLPGNLTVNPLSPTGSFAPNPVANGLIREIIGRSSDRFAGRDDQTFSFSDQQRASASASWRLSLATFGELKSAKAHERQAALKAEQALDRVRGEVVMAVQASGAHEQLITLSSQQVASAEEALRLTQVNLRAGAMTTLDVLQAQDAATQARLRYAESVVRYNQSQVNLLAALGLLNSDTLLSPERQQPKSEQTDQSDQPQGNSTDNG